MKKTILTLALILAAASGSVAQDFEVSGRLRAHVMALCDESLRGRLAGTPGEKAASDYVYDCMESSGLLMPLDKEGQDFAIGRGNDTIWSRNIIGFVEGADPKLKDEYIVIGASFDAPGTNTLTVDGQKLEQVYPGADANASGVAVMLELARLAASYDFLFPRSLLFVGFGASEQGFAGSWYFANRAFGQMDKVVAMIDLNMLGGGPESRFTYFSQIPLRYLTTVLDKTCEEAIVIKPSMATGEIVQSDHLPFYDKDIPVVSFTTGMHRRYHTVKDSPEALSYSDMEFECNYLFYFLKTLASMQDAPRVPRSGAEHSAGIGVSDGGDKVYAAAECDQRPEFFRSGEMKFLESCVYKYLKYPPAALASGIQGKVMVSFVVEKDGRVTNVEVISGVDDDLDQEAVRVVSVSPKWSPGRIKGEKVRTRVTIPVEFRLTTQAPKFRIKK